MFQCTDVRRWLLTAVVGLLVLAGVWACESSEPPANSPASPDRQRLVSLSPAITQMIIDLGRGDRIVGIGRFDPAAGQLDAPVVGDLYNLDYEKLLAVEPTDIFLQPHTHGVPEKLRDLAEDRRWGLHVYNIETVVNVKNALFDNFGEGVGAVLGLPDEALNLRERIDLQMGAILAISLDYAAPRTLLLVSLNPLTGAGPDTFLDEMLNVAGGRNVLESEANRYPVMDKERIAALKPEVIVIISSSSGGGEGSVGAQAPEELPAALADLDMPAVRDGKVHWLIDQQAMLPSTSVPRITAKLAAILHPKSAQEFHEQVSPQAATP